MPFFPLTLFHGAAGAKTCIRCAKKNQSRSDYLQARSAYYAPKAPVVGAEGAWCREKNTVAKRLLQARSAYYAPKAPVVGAEGAWCRGLCRCRRHLGNVIGAAGALLRGLQWRRRRPTLRSGAEQLVYIYRERDKFKNQTVKR